MRCSLVSISIRDSSRPAKLYRVARSLDSLVVGEPKILWQVKDAMHAAREAGCLNTQLGNLFEKPSVWLRRFAVKLKLPVRRFGLPAVGDITLRREFPPLAYPTSARSDRLKCLKIGHLRLAKCVPYLTVCAAVKRLSIVQTKGGADVRL